MMQAKRMGAQSAKKSAKLGQFAAVAAVSAFALIMGTAAQAETLKDAIAMAYAQNPTLARERASQRGTDETYVQARAGFGPSVSASGTSTYTTPAYQTNGSVNSSTIALSASQTLYASGGLSASLDAAKSGVLAGQQSLRSAEASVLLNVISAYTAVRRDQQALKISQDNYDILKKQLDQTQAQFDVGQLTRTDVAQSQARTLASAAALAQAQAQLDADRATYIAIVGQAPVALEAEPTLPGLPTGFDAALAAAEANNPDLQAALYAEAAAKARVKSAKSAYGPTVAVSASSGTTATNTRAADIGFDKGEATSTTLRLSIPLYTAGINSSRVREATEGYNAQKLTVDITRRSVVSQVSQAWSQMLAAKSAVASNEQQVKAAQVAADGIKIEQQVGLRTNIEVLNAQQDLKSAQLALIDSQRSQYIAGSQLLSVVGGLTAKAFVPDIEVYDPQTNFDQVKSKGWSPLEPVTRVLDGLAK